MNEKCYSFKGQSWRVEPWEGTILWVSSYNQCSFTKVQNQQTKPRQESTKVDANEIDLIWSQSCSLLHSQNKYQRKIPICFLQGYGESNHFEIYQNTVFFSFSNLIYLFLYGCTGSLFLYLAFLWLLSVAFLWWVGATLVVVHELLIVVASFVAGHGF